MSEKKKRRIADEIKALESRAGKLIPADVVALAADPKSPLHNCFVWDDSVCGVNYRLEQAEELIRSVTIEVASGDETIRTVRYVSSPVREQSYTNITRMSREAAQSHLLDEIRRLDGNARRTHLIAKAYGTKISADVVGGLQTVCRLTLKMLGELE